MLTLLFYLHSGVRWLVVLAMIVALGWMIFSFIRRRDLDRVTRTIMATFGTLVAIQWLLGIILFLVYSLASGDMQLYWATHFTFMTLVFIVAHLHIAARRFASTQNYYVISIVIILVVIVLIYFGVATLPGDRWQLISSYAPS